MEIPKSFLGYKRENGRAGTRNHVIILPVDDIFYIPFNVICTYF